MIWGLWDTVDKCWMGSNNTPLADFQAPNDQYPYPEHSPGYRWANLARHVLAERMQLGGELAAARFEIKELPKNLVIREEFVPPVSGEQAIKNIEERATHGQG